MSTLIAFLLSRHWLILADLKSLANEKKCFHRDTSNENLRLYPKEDSTAVVLDLDLTQFSCTVPQTCTELRTEAAPFMARELLVGVHNQCQRGLHHDLESLFYVLVWYALDYRGRIRPRKDPLWDWRMGKYAEIKKVKEAFISQYDLNNDRDTLYDIKVVATKIQLQSIRRAYKSRTGNVAMWFITQSRIMSAKRNDAEAAIIAQAEEEGWDEAAIDDRILEINIEYGDAPDRKLQTEKPTNAISFKKLMQAAGKQEEVVEEHLGCRCCDDDII